MSATIQDVAKNLGLSVRAVRLRLDVLDGTLSPLLKRGENNQLIFTGDAVGMLQHLEEIRRSDGISVKAAASILRKTEKERLENADLNNVEAVTLNHVEQASNQASNPESGNEWIQALIKEKDRTIERLEVENTRLQDRIDQLLPLALPAPRRRFITLFRRKSAITA